MSKRQFSQNTPKQRGVGTKTVLLSLVALFVFFLLLSSVVELFGKYRGIRAHIKELKTEQSQLEQKKKSMVAMNEYIQSPEGKEEVFRDKYRLVKPGEGMIVITNEKADAAVTPPKPAIARFWDNLLRGLGLR